MSKHRLKKGDWFRQLKNFNPHSGYVKDSICKLTKDVYEDRGYIWYESRWYVDNKYQRDVLQYFTDDEIEPIAVLPEDEVLMAMRS